MLTQNDIDIAKRDLDDSISSYTKLIEIAEARDDRFSKIKLAFLAFLGVILTSIISARKDDSSYFTDKDFILLTIILSLAVVTFFVQSYLLMKDSGDGIRNSQRSLLLKKIRHIASIEHRPEFQGSFSRYGQTVEDLHRAENKALRMMEDGKVIEDIISSFSSKRYWWLDYFWWGILFLSVPAVFLNRVLQFNSEILIITMNFYTFSVIYLSIGFIMSLFYGLRAVRIFGYPNKNQETPNYLKSWHFHQFWFNFIGSATGWFFFYIFLKILQSKSLGQLTFTNIVTAVLGIFGIVGLLPMMFYGVAGSIHQLFEKVVARLR